MAPCPQIPGGYNRRVPPLCRWRHEGLIERGVVMPPRRGFKAFVEQHDVVFTVLGAALVFIGFVMRDGFRETNKDVAALLTATQFNADLQESLAEISEDVRELRRSQMESENKFPSRIEDPHIAFIVDAFDYRVAQSGVNERYLTSTFQVAHSLFEHLPEKTLPLRIMDARASVLIDQLGRHTPDLSKSQILLFLELTRRSHSRHEAVQIAETANEKAIKELSSYEEFEYRCFQVIPDFKDQVVQEIERQRRCTENRLRWATLGSYFLFAIGWLLGLIGKLWKISALSEAPEG